MDRVIGAVETRTHLPAILKAVTYGKRFIITQRSHARAVLISPEELESLEAAADRGLLEDLMAARKDIRMGRTVRAKTYFLRKKG